MFRFIREKILPLFLEREITIYELAQLSGVSHRTCQRAVNGEKVTAPIVTRICRALGISSSEQVKFIQGALKV
ncbi:MAG: helix-turn-helix transcriptional regulator [Selenomonadaceae bacterium]|nr:helix-turn-helix transcriptional regulator [Selenomonadaceae bacterium]